MIAGMLGGTIPDYQISAWLMAVLCRGFTRRETTKLTQCMLASGAVLPRVSDRPRVDKHSTGGLGDKVSLILTPILAACGVEVPMLSGRGLGITGGTLDKLESYKGFRTNLTEAEIGDVLSEVGCVITGASPGIAPADKKLYALRDVTGTVPSVALITASILSKKLAESLDALVLDVKFGSGTFMKQLENARELAESLKTTAENAGLPTQVTLSSMEQPLGQMIGNACECNESVAVLKGEGPNDVRELSLHFAAALLTATGISASAREAKDLARNSIDSGRALETFQHMVAAQGGNFCDRLSLARTHPVIWQDAPGFVTAVNGELIGNAVISLGGGRQKVGQAIDHRVGIRLQARIGDELVPGSKVAEVFTDSGDAFALAATAIQNALVLGHERPAEFVLIREPPSN